MVLLLQNKKLNHFFFNENKIIDINIVFLIKNFLKLYSSIIITLVHISKKR